MNNATPSAVLLHAILFKTTFFRGAVTLAAVLCTEIGGNYFCVDIINEMLVAICSLDWLRTVMSFTLWEILYQIIYLGNFPLSEFQANWCIISLLLMKLF